MKNHMFMVLTQTFMVMVVVPKVQSSLFLPLPGFIFSDRLVGYQSSYGNSVMFLWPSVSWVYLMIVLQIVSHELSPPALGDVSLSCLVHLFCYLGIPSICMLFCVYHDVLVIG